MLAFICILKLTLGLTLPFNFISDTWQILSSSLAYDHQGFFWIVSNPESHYIPKPILANQSYSFTTCHLIK